MGRLIDSKLAERDKKGKPVHRLVDLLNDGDTPAPGQYTHIDVSTLRKVHVREDGTWDE